MSLRRGTEGSFPKEETGTGYFFSTDWHLLASACSGLFIALLIIYTDRETWLDWLTIDNTNRRCEIGAIENIQIGKVPVIQSLNIPIRSIIIVICGYVNLGI
ncbi:hypothetical protein C900_05906 [Fulvivirga imtechensis AK7]|uniref:Uncharacterized protein n=1 Tax=Fulvivirga imtechensis AK7 TaxID=1237149 RepID=L8JKG9_9BACT|nr:hypothetical protein C900_05906 [Fulvivirga imtechensis AK7]